MSGVFNSWTGILVRLINFTLLYFKIQVSNHGLTFSLTLQSSLFAGQYTDEEAGWFSFSSTIAAIIGGLLVCCILQDSRHLDDFVRP